MVSTNQVAVVLALSDVAIVIALCIYGDYISALGMTVMGIICIGGGLVAQAPYGRTTSTSA